jgi:anthranilate synthase component 2
VLCLIDNYDSFTYNLVHYLHELDADVRVILNDEMAAADVLALGPSHLVLSPGPGTPDESGITKELLALAAGAGIPTLGVCLGHEVIGEVFGGRVRHARRVMHGKTSRVWHSGDDVFANLPSPFVAARYHSLVIEEDSLPACLKVTAWTTSGDAEGGGRAGAAKEGESDGPSHRPAAVPRGPAEPGLVDGPSHRPAAVLRGPAEPGLVDEIMAIAHRSLPIYGVQFHPESILSEHGHSLLANFLAIGRAASTGAGPALARRAS